MKQSYCLKIYKVFKRHIKSSQKKMNTAYTSPQENQKQPSFNLKLEDVQ